MPTATWTPLANLTLGSSASSVTFSNIPNTYRDLILITRGKSDDGNDFILYFNGDESNSNYSRVIMLGDGSVTASYATSGSNPAAIYTSDGALIHHILDYSATDKHKTYLARASTSAVVVSAGAARWANTAAITTMKVKAGTANFQSGTTFALYGVIA